MHIGEGARLRNRPFSHISDLNDLDPDLGFGSYSPNTPPATRARWHHIHTNTNYLPNFVQIRRLWTYIHKYMILTVLGLLGEESS